MSKENGKITVLRYMIKECRAGYNIYISELIPKGVVISNGPLLINGKINYEGYRGLIELTENYIPTLNSKKIHCKDCPFDRGCKVIYGKNGTIYSSQNSDIVPPETPKTL